MQVGMFHEFQRRPGQTEAQAFTESFEQVDEAERAGHDVIWLAELHFAPERSVLAAPLYIATANASRTKSMNIGTAGRHVVLPLCPPLRIAEAEATTVDHISRGRLIMGVGRSGFPRTYQAYNISYAESRERFVEVLEIMKRAWTQERFSFHGKYYDFDNVSCVPKPFAPPYPEIRVAVNSSDTFQEQGERGNAIFVATRLGNLDELHRPQPRRLPRRRRPAPAISGNGKVYLRVPVYIAENEKQAREEPMESVMFFYRYLGERIEASAVMEGARAIENRAEKGARLQHIDYEEVNARSKINRRPPRCGGGPAGRQIKEAVVGLAGILAELNCGMRIPHHQVVNSLNLMCQEVRPKFQS